MGGHKVRHYFVTTKYVISFPRNHFVRTKYVISFPRNHFEMIFEILEMISRERNMLYVMLCICYMFVFVYVYMTFHDDTNMLWRICYDI